MSNQIDFQAVSIDPMKPKIKTTSQTTIVASLKNNGPDVIEKGDIIVHITVNGRFARKPNSFSSKAWKLQGIKTEQGNYEIYAENKSPIEMNETTELKFIVKAKAVGKIDITLVSTVAPTSSASDINGDNQSVRTELIVV